MTDSAPQPLPQLYPHQFRADGWPLCPVCGEDEVWSSLTWTEEMDRPTIAGFLEGPLACYRCNWRKPRE